MDVINFSLFAYGYPAAMGVYCKRHLGEAILKDGSFPGSTDRWVVRMTTKECETCPDEKPEALPLKEVPGFLSWLNPFKRRR
jgi:hypothetical protein